MDLVFWAFIDVYGNSTKCFKIVEMSEEDIYVEEITHKEYKVATNNKRNYFQFTPIITLDSL